MSDTIGLGHHSILLRKVCLLRSELLSSRLFSGVFLGLALLHNPASFSLHLLLLPLGHLLLDFDFVFAFRLLLVLHADTLQRLEPREPWLERCTTTGIVHGRFGPTSSVGSCWLQPLVHNQHEAFLLGCQGFVGRKLCHRPLASLR